MVGFVGGEDDPTQQRIERCFIAGARNTVKDIQGLGIITGDYDNAAEGREAASTLVGNGADVIWHAADVTGLGAIQGAIAGKAKVLGCYSDQTSLAPNNMATSFEMNLGGVVQTVAHAVANHTFAGGTEWKPAVDWMWLLKREPTVTTIRIWFLLPIGPHFKRRGAIWLRIGSTSLLKVATSDGCPTSPIFCGV